MLIARCSSFLHLNLPSFHLLVKLLFHFFELLQFFIYFLHILPLNVFTLIIEKLKGLNTRFHSFRLWGG